MKARTIPVDQLDSPPALLQRIVSVRFAELLERSRALAAGGVEELHAMRIACKRLRYAVETFGPQLPNLSQAAQALRTMQDTLGELHDCDVLAATAARHSVDLVYARLLRDRGQLLLSARAHWKNAFRLGGNFERLILFANLGCE